MERFTGPNEVWSIRETRNHVYSGDSVTYDGKGLTTRAEFGTRIQFVALAFDSRWKETDIEQNAALSRNLNKIETTPRAMSWTLASTLSTQSDFYESSLIMFNLLALSLVQDCASWDSPCQGESILPLMPSMKRDYGHMQSLHAVKVPGCRCWPH